MNDPTEFAIGPLPQARWGSSMPARGTVGHLLDHAARLHGRRTVIITPERTLTYAELDRLSNRLAAGLSRLGVQPGNRVTIWMENDWRWPVAYYGVMRAGAVAVPANSQLTSREISFLLNDSGSTAVLGPGPKIAELDNLPVMRIDTSPEPGRHEIYFGDLTEGDSSTARWNAPDIAAGEICSINYTSGTTGFPKGAMLRHEAVVLSAAMTALMQGKHYSDTVVTALPCSHVYGCSVLNSAVSCGMTLVLLNHLDEPKILEAIERYQATILEGVPAMYLTMLRLGDLERFNLSSLRLCSVGGQGMALHAMSEVESRLGCPLRELWGMTEIAGPGTTHPYNGPGNLGSIGLPLPFLETRICDPSDNARIITDDSVGQLFVKGPQVMAGYNGNAKATSEILSSEGWLQTGDLVRRDERGYLYVVDRLKEVILSGGYSIYPSEIERVLLGHPDIAYVVVVGRADPVRGQIAKAHVELRPGSHCTHQDLRAFCRQQLAGYKIPREFEFTDKLPRTPSGKISRFAHRERAN